MEIEIEKTKNQNCNNLRHISNYLSTVEDFRMEKKCLHKLSDILFIGLLTFLSSGEDYEDMVLFAKTHRDFLQDYLSLPNGIPSHDTFRRVFSILDADILRKCLNDYGKDMISILSEKQICLDGKKLRGVSPASRGNRGLYILNAWVAENRICIGQKRIEDKSNEITALPALIEELDINQAVVSIDAIGCQREIAKQITEKGGHYLLSLKKNQGELYDHTVGGFKACASESVCETWEYDHGRYETRRCSIISAQKALLCENLEQWSGLKTLIRVESTRNIKGLETTEIRYYISSEQGENAKYFNQLVRGHWGIENHLHWHLDVSFKEDASRVRTANAPENLSTLRKLALQLITEQKDKLSMRKRRLKAAYDINYLKKIIG
jgi:predicted transposase YbfD/YdcC